MCARIWRRIRGPPVEVGSARMSRPLYLAHTTLLDATATTVIDAAAAAGYHGVGLRVHPSPNLPYHPLLGRPDLIRAVRHALSANRLEVLDALSFYLLPDTDVATMLPALDLAAHLGARYVLAQGNDPDPARQADSFAIFCAAAGRFGLRVALEFVPARQLATLAQAVDLITETDPGNAGILVDTLHLANSGGTAADLADLDPGLLAYAQISDGRDGARALPGKGQLPLAAMLAALPHDLPLSVEVLQPQEGSHAHLDVRAWAALTLTTTRALVP